MLRLHDRTVLWVAGTWDSLQGLPFTSVPLAEVRRPELVDTIEDLPVEEQDELTSDLAGRVTGAPTDSPAVCHLDTGVRRTHVLLEASLDSDDEHTVVPGGPADRANHGTPMAGLALFGHLDGLLLGAAPIIALRHRLESVKVLPDPGGAPHDPLTYGVVTAEGVAAPEAAKSRPRVFCMPITDTSDVRPGEPTLWSASIDALAVGVDIGRRGNTLELLSEPKADASRLFVISAGNVRHPDFAADYKAACDLAPIEDPAQAWNALTVGAYTDLADTPSDPTFQGWTPLGQAGDISPLSRTSVSFARKWPLKPDICMEGGNVLRDGPQDQALD